MPIIDIAVAQNQLPGLVEAVRHGEEVIISQGGELVAQLVALRPTKVVRRLGTMKGKIWIADDFDAPLPDDLQAAFEGK
ncbi:type II toxin-antitoxin system prevent-host-death family antitoxin [Duganella dendranthematis]|jgi:prevent-host-death family protein|uniref:Type II toxin-antitoxin system prevent-host-death family antitoxin n=1 Tax=Duganella dendranthematis TaxID=2728021 RepID=A0ABX6M8U4_9BURK|nr:type II toxin-antitoxin system prevent-host-death family antitoxin [Duganella dendranthematis]QJD90525.1 type II toxin-antitoxin system prevent-host-death family antitoxin [Duganella dendranthematis]